MRNKSHKQNSENGTNVKRVAIISVCVVLVLWGLTFFLFFYRDFETQGQFGDMFGAVNALFSGLAFAGLILTLILQKNELSLQRSELQMTREELKTQREEFEKENETLKYQRFENLFYNMLNLQQEIVNGLRDECETEQHSSIQQATGGYEYETRKVPKEIMGREVFKFVYEKKEIYYNSADGGEREVRGFKEVLQRNGINAYANSWTTTIFDHYFRHLYKILQFVDSQNFPFEEAYKYISFLRGTLSRYELVWIYYNGLQPRNRKFKTLIEKYSLLKNLRREMLGRSAETEAYINRSDLSEYGITDNWAAPINDYEFFLTDDPKEKSKYQLTAFWKKEDVAQGEKVLAKFRKYIPKTSKN